MNVKLHSLGLTCPGIEPESTVSEHFETLRSMDFFPILVSILASYRLRAALLIFVQKEFNLFLGRLP